MQITTENDVIIRFKTMARGLKLIKWARERPLQISLQILWVQMANSSMVHQ